jgi:hypothetical protein
MAPFGLLKAKYIFVVPLLSLYACNNPKTGGFGDYHHAHKDNMSIIDKNTLKAVGQTLLQTIYSE